MRSVREVMRGDIEVLRTTETVADAASFLAAHREDSVLLCLGDGSLAGRVSSRDIVTRVVAKGRDPREVRLAEFAEPAGVVALDVDLSVEEAASIMCRQRRDRLPVTDGARVVGFVTRGDAACSASWRPPWDDG